jgi:hypothetical protein
MQRVATVAMVFSISGFNKYLRNKHTDIKKAKVVKLIYTYVIIVVNILRIKIISEKICASTITLP